MAVSSESAGEMSVELIRLIKVLRSVRGHAPRIHPAVDASAYPMLFILDEGPRRVSELAECIHSDVSTVSRQVSALAAGGLLEKLTDPLDGRVQLVSLTEPGRDLLTRIRAERAEFFRGVLADWRADDVARFTAYLRRLTHDIGQPRGPQRPAHALPETPLTPETTP